MDAMRRFIDEKGTFEIKVPITWRYSLKNNKVHTFQEYEIWKSDTFQLSILKIETPDEERNIKNVTNSLPQIKIGKLDYFQFPDDVNKMFKVKIWTRKFENKVVIFTLTSLNKPDKSLDNQSIEDKIKRVYTIINSFKLIDEHKSTIELKYYRFEMFLQGIGATSLIVSKAIENKAFIEATCILANQIDALLRTGIILKKQILNHDSEIESEWIYQGISDKKKSEKEIYLKSKDLGIIDDCILTELMTLYEDRNRVVHRFIISEITLAEVEEIAYSYYKQQEKVYQIVYDLESEQIKLGLGMTRRGGQAHSKDLMNSFKGKIGKLDYFDKKDLTIKKLI